MQILQHFIAVGKPICHVPCGLVSLWTESFVKPAELLEMCVDLGLLHDGRLDPCKWCESTNWILKPRVTMLLADARQKIADAPNLH